MYIYLKLENIFFNLFSRDVGESNCAPLPARTSESNRDWPESRTNRAIQIGTPLSLLKSEHANRSLTQAQVSANSDRSIPGAASDGGESSGVRSCRNGSTPRRAAPSRLMSVCLSIRYSPALPEPEP